jgi:hypothetical protein
VTIIDPLRPLPCSEAPTVWFLVPDRATGWAGVVDITGDTRCDGGPEQPEITTTAPAATATPATPAIPVIIGPPARNPAPASYMPQQVNDEGAARVHSGPAAMARQVRQVSSHLHAAG